jgi:hypothetical protein
MSRKPWVAFYAGGLIAELPDAAPDSLAARARATGATVLVADERSAAESRPRLLPLLDPGASPWPVLWRSGGPRRLVLYDVSPAATDGRRGTP